MSLVKGLGTSCDPFFGREAARDLILCSSNLKLAQCLFQEVPTSVHVSDTVADPGFPRGGGVNPPERCQHTILPNFPKNYMTLKEFGP